MKAKKLPALDIVKQALNYDPETGEFSWAKTKSGRKQKVGSVSPQGYLRICFGGKSYMASRLAWLLHYGEDPGEMCVDHINRDRQDNRISNLRLCSHQQNSANIRWKGICFIKGINKWRATVRVRKQLKTHTVDCPLIAHLWYVDKRAELTGEFTPT